MITYISKERKYGIDPVRETADSDWVFVVKGKCRPVFDDGEELPYSSNKAWLFTNRASHGFDFGDKGADIYRFRFCGTTQTLRLIFNRDNLKYLSIDLNEDDICSLEKIYKNTIHAVKQSSDSSLVKSDCCGPQLSVLFYKKLKNLENIYDPYKNDLEGYLKANDALGWYIDNMSLNPTADEVAQYMKITPTHMCRLFKKHFNLTPIIYFQRIRIKAAKSLLASSNIKLSDISEFCGFSSPSDLSRSFKKFENLSPNEWLKRARHSREGSV